ncbi:PAS domain S-box protein [Bradyrhizobium sp. STM 3562]|uniref:PAS domain S-box protein n=1 Tax=Bradyrhizobium sp. STM 3562 TaxID=578924 RepID=UPI00388E5A53
MSTTVSLSVNCSPLWGSNPEQSALHPEESRVPGGEAWCRDLIASLPAAIYTTDAAGRITYYNEAAAELWGCRPELGNSEFCGSWKLYRADGSAMRHDECPMAVCLKLGRPIRGIEAVAERPDGTRISFLPYPTPIFDTRGKLIGAVNMLMDISQRKQAEMAAQRLAAIVESSEDAIVSKDLNGIIQTWNHGAERLFGYEAAEAIGKSILIVIPPDRHDEEHRILESIRRGERIEHYETVRRRKDGSLVDISLTVSPVKDVAGRILGASKIARDITERKRAQARNELLSREIQHRTKNLFAVVQSVVARSFVGKRSVEEAEAAVRSRLSSLAQTHVMLLDKPWEGAELAQVIAAEMRPYGSRVKIGGPRVMLNPTAAQNFGLAIHELATNAAKYGSLSNEAGWVDVSWAVTGSNGSKALSLTWQECAGPPVNIPGGRGFGSTVLEVVMSDYGQSQINYASEGLVYHLTAPLSAITLSPAACSPSRKHD